MVMGTLANLYAIQQTFSTTKVVEKENVGTKSTISEELKANDLTKQQLNVKSMYLFVLVFLSYLENSLKITTYFCIF